MISGNDPSKKASARAFGLAAPAAPLAAIRDKAVDAGVILRTTRHLFDENGEHDVWRCHRTDLTALVETSGPE